MSNIFEKLKDRRLQKAIKKQNIKRESDISQKVEIFPTMPCGFWQSDMIKRRFKNP